jgi:hypothetical protein
MSDKIYKRKEKIQKHVKLLTWKGKMSAIVHLHRITLLHHHVHGLLVAPSSSSCRHASSALSRRHCAPSSLLHPLTVSPHPLVSSHHRVVAVVRCAAARRLRRWWCAVCMLRATGIGCLCTTPGPLCSLMGWGSQLGSLAHGVCCCRRCGPPL